MQFKSLLSLLLAITFSLFFYEKTSAQCEYRLDLSDSYGDGWNGGILHITSGTIQYDFTLNNINDDGVDSTIFFQVLTGQALTITWEAGSFNTEVSMIVTNYDGAQIVNESGPDDGILYSGTGVCPSCLKPANFRLENIYDTRVKLRWDPVEASPAIGWWLIYLPQDSVLGSPSADTVYVTQPKTTLLGLTEMTAYKVYLKQDCGAGDASDLVGPIAFKTYWSDDVGIAGVRTPLSGCDLGTETVSILIKNHGANPQSLVPFFYSVNGQPASIPFPQDGFYTGVLGKDSCELVPFETMFNFSEPGEYTIAVWTEMMNDDDTSNDTFIYRIVNRLLIPYAQNFEDWEGGWHVDTSSAKPSWEFGTPAKLQIANAASGVNAWVTSLSGTYNGGEKSYLNSPCFDLSDQTQDPVIEFSINHWLENNYDALYLEMSLDGGTTWGIVGAQNEGVNWYNNELFDVGDVWSGNNGGWQHSRHSLPGTAGESSVRLRFVLRSDFFGQYEGVGIDDIRIYVPLAKDLAATQISTTNGLSQCGAEADKVTFRITNLGSQSQSVYKVAYSLNGGAPIIETVSNPTLAPDASYDYTFNATFDSRDVLSSIKCWTLLAGELNNSNDTTTYSVDHRPLPVPLFENFQSGNLPGGWLTTDGNVTNAHNNTTQVLAVNLYSFNTEFTHDLPRHGPISAGDSLFFDYRITNYNFATGVDGTVPTEIVDSKVEIQVSTDCGDSFETIYTIDSATHTPVVPMTKVKIDLSQYAGSAINIRMLGTWGEGDFWVDFDNINIRTCPASMMLSATITNSPANQNNGKAKVTVGLGNPPFKYAWSNGTTFQTAANLNIGTYTVTVTDSKGCSDVLEVSIGDSPTSDIASLVKIALQPNPTTGLSVLRLDFEKSVNVQVQVLNLLGQVLQETAADHVNTLTEPLDLSRENNGMYLVRIVVDGQVRTVKLVKNNG